MNKQEQANLGSFSIHELNSFIDFRHSAFKETVERIRDNRVLMVTCTRHEKEHDNEMEMGMEKSGDATSLVDRIDSDCTKSGTIN